MHSTQLEGILCSCGGTSMQHRRLTCRPEGSVLRSRSAMSATQAASQRAGGASSSAAAGAALQGTRQRGGSVSQDELKLTSARSKNAVYVACCVRKQLHCATVPAAHRDTSSAAARPAACCSAARREVPSGCAAAHTTRIRRRAALLVLLVATKACRVAWENVSQRAARSRCGAGGRRGGGGRPPASPPSHRGCQTTSPAE